MVAILIYNPEKTAVTIRGISAGIIYAPHPIARGHAHDICGINVYIR
jgi:hypothetical protein